ncbi:MAG: energy transducer TonB [Sphingobacteriales bacterium]|nr:MAG: energy transducer TonB [Sphingobacteriales bacterium]
MKTSIWLTLDDLIFEGRNKMYGAYLLRKEYPRHLAIAVSVIAGLLLLALPLPQYLSRNSTFDNVKSPDKPDERVLVILEPPLKDISEFQQPAQPVSPPPPSVSTPATTLPTTIATTDDVVTATPIDQVTGTPLAGGVDGGTGIVETTGTTGATDTGTGTAPVAVAPVIVDYAEVKPQFPGGEAELIKQINKLVRYPEVAIRDDISGIVYVSFVVDPKGNVSRIKIEKGIGGGCDQEAVRVISQLKGWSPAMQNGNPVFFKYVMPVRFVLRN